MPSITLTWDPMPPDELWTEVRIYEGSARVGIAVMPQTFAEFAVERGQHSFTARSFDGVFESDDSNAVDVRVPSPPGHLRK